MTPEQARKFAELWTTRTPENIVTVVDAARVDGHSFALILQAVDGIYGPNDGARRMREFYKKIIEAGPLPVTPVLDLTNLAHSGTAVMPVDGLSTHDFSKHPAAINGGLTVDAPQPLPSPAPDAAQVASDTPPQPPTETA